VTSAGEAELLKRDLFGTVSRVYVPRESRSGASVERDTDHARWWVRGLARRLARREARALEALARVQGVPTLESWDGHRLRRTWLDGEPMQLAKPADPAYYREAVRLLRRLHAAGVLHNDLAKEPNWLVTPDGRPALVDFQLSSRPRYRGRLFRMQAYDDLRHLLKHKRTYCPERLSARQRAILARRSPLAAFWAYTGKPVYRIITRGILGWADREGAGDRGAAHQGSTVSKSSEGWSPGRK
jgi:RIO-like serine/threonine protein kinase